MNTSLPTAFIEQMKVLLPMDFEHFAAALTTVPPVSIRLNPSKATVKALSHLPLRSPVPWHPHAYYLNSRPSFTLDPFFHTGAYYVQEASSMFLHEVLQQTTPTDRPLRILDLCAAPGGKTTLIASWMPKGSLLIANEVIKSRVGALKQNLARWGHANVFTCSYDPETFLPLTGWFDLVVVDAPCSGEGLFRKNNQAHLEWSPESTERCAARQRRILNVARKLVATGGTLVYSTCTYNPRENETNAQWLTNEGDMPALQIDRSEKWDVSERQPGYQMYPHRTEGEGFYIAAFRQAGRVIASEKRKKDFYKLTTLSQKELKVVSAWIPDSEKFSFLRTSEGEVVYYPKELTQDLLTLDYLLPVGVWLHEAGQLKGTTFIPAHSLALAHVSCATEIPAIELDERQALLYLKKELSSLPSEAPTGWLTANYGGLPLGWIRNLGSRFNNYFPSGQRIIRKVEG